MSKNQGSLKNGIKNIGSIKSNYIINKEIIR